MSMLRRRVTILGATGSVGLSTARVIEELRAGGDEIAVEAIAGGSNVAALADMARRLRPRFVALAAADQLEAARVALKGLDVEVAAGPEAVVAAAERDAEWVMSAIVGAAGVRPTLAAARRGALIALANKESLVCAGGLIQAAVAKSGARIVPVDSEHNAIFQVLGDPAYVERLTLTASGGPFRGWTRQAMAAATPEQARKHPNWDMGPKNSVDSATLMNKGLELIEAAHLFGFPVSKLDVLVHPQSIVHALVSYCDGSVLAQMAEPDMRVPIAHALAWPERAAVSTRRLDLARSGPLEFAAPDLERFPALGLAQRALEAGGAAPTLLNAANEVAVAAFLERRIGFLDIAGIVEVVLARHAAGGLGDIANSPSSFDEVMAVDTAGRVAAQAETARRRAA
ncbi:MAG: 1-deoxy-D-xylulose-5-phosphate reductoisomerase [Hyphomonadaceae bacterium]